MFFKSELKWTPFLCCSPILDGLEIEQVAAFEYSVMDQCLLENLEINTRVYL